jgi:AcrR family transcriptional regulator
MAYSTEDGDASTTTPASRGGRPRSKEVHRAILQATFDLVLRDGFRVVSVEAIAASAGVSKASIYRRWPNKAAMVMDAFTEKVGSGSLFPKTASATESIRLQMRAMAKSFCGSDGALVKTLLAEAQFDPELAKAFRERWTIPRRKLGMAVVQQAIRQGEMPADVDPGNAIDILYGPMYYRLQMGTGQLSSAYVEKIFRRVMKGLGAKRS